MRFHQAVTFLPTPHALELAKAADEQGYDGIVRLGPHVLPPRTVSRATRIDRRGRRPGFGDHWDPDTWPDSWCLISGHGRRDPSTSSSPPASTSPRPATSMTVAKQVGTAAVLSQGRVRLGVGVGWCEEEFEATGQDFPTRGKRLDEMIPALRALWAGGWVEYHGPHYDMPALRMEPGSPAPVPIIGGGRSAAGPPAGGLPVRRMGGRRRRYPRSTWSSSASSQRSSGRAPAAAETSHSHLPVAAGPCPTSICTGASRRPG